MEFKNVNEAIAIIENRHDWTKGKVALNRFNEYIQYKKNPQYGLKCIHITGTNGKGSTSKALQVILTEAGYKVGSFNSPNMISRMDGICIDGKPILEKDYLSYVNAYFEEWEEFDLSIFEVETFLSFQYFLDQSVDLAIYEVGMGGKDDATNVIDSMISCVTNIGLDHCSFLGDTYSKIAYTKGGIIKKDSLFITNEKREDCLEVFRKICKEKHTKFIKNTYIPTNIVVDSCLHFDTGTYLDLKVPTIARYQSTNISFAIGILEALKEKKLINYSKEDVYKGLLNFYWAGRFEVIRKDPLVILDGAHNKEGIDTLIDSLKGISDLSVIFSALKDKPYEYMLDRLCEVSKDIVVCEFDFYRAEKAEKLAGYKEVKVIKDFKEAICIKMKENHPLLICGSLYFIRQVKEFLKEK